jgi:phage terminase small subunit
MPFSTKGQNMKPQPPRQIIGYLKNPATWNALAFETLMRDQLEKMNGEIHASDEILLGTLLIQMESLLAAHTQVTENGQTSVYNSGTATSPFVKIRNDAMDKIFKILIELALVAKSRTNKPKTKTEIDALFDTA